MSRTKPPRRPVLGLAAVLSGVLLASCQTSADEVLSLGETAPSEEAGVPRSSKTLFRDPYVLAVSGQPADVAASLASQNATDPPQLKRKPVPLAAAYSDIAEPPPEVLALQQQAGNAESPAPRQPAATQDIGALTMQPTAVTPASNSLFAAGQKTTAATGVEPATATAEVAAATPAPRSSLVPSEMPTLGVNAMRKSLFSPSPEQQMLLQQQALEAEARNTAATEQIPLTESVSPGGEEPVLKKLSDPRPKRKMLALREPAATVPERVQLTPDQLQAMGAVAEPDPAEPLPAEALVAEAEAGQPKKRWLPSLSDLLKGGKTREQATQAP